EDFHTGTMHYIGFKRELDIYNNLIIVYRDTDDREKMLEIFSQVENLAQNHEFDQTEKNQYAGGLQSIARYYLHQEHDLDRASKLRIERTAIHFGDVAVSLQADRAHAYLLKKDYQQSLKIIQRIEQKHTLQTHQIELKAKNLLGLRKPSVALVAVNELLAAMSEENRNFQFPESDLEDFTPGYVITDAES